MPEKRCREKEKENADTNKLTQHAAEPARAGVLNNCQLKRMQAANSGERGWQLFKSVMKTSALTCDQTARARYSSSHHPTPWSPPHQTGDPDSAVLDAQTFCNGLASLSSPKKRTLDAGNPCLSVCLSGCFSPQEHRPPPLELLRKIHQRSPTSF